MMVHSRMKTAHIRMMFDARVSAVTNVARMVRLVLADVDESFCPAHQPCFIEGRKEVTLER